MRFGRRKGEGGQRKGHKVNDPIISSHVKQDIYIISFSIYKTCHFFKRLDYDMCHFLCCDKCHIPNFFTFN